MSMCRVISCVVGRGCLLWPVRSLGRTLLAFALLHSVLQGRICLLLQVFHCFEVILKSFVIQSLSRVQLCALHQLQHAWLPCPSLSPTVCSNSCPLSWWCHPTISSSVTPFSFCPLAFLAPRVFSSESTVCIRWPKGTILPINIQSWFPLGLISLISLQSKGLLRVFSSTTIWKNQFIGTQPFLWSSSGHPYLNTGKTFDYMC